MKEVTYSIGQRFSYGGVKKFILALGEGGPGRGGRVSLIDLKSGMWFCPPKKVKDVWGVTKKEIEQMYIYMWVHLKPISKKEDI